MNKLWRLHTKTDSIMGEKIAQYCLDNSCLAMGWSLKDEHINNKLYKLTEKQIEEIYDLRRNIQTYDDYKNIISEYGIYGRQVNSSVHRLYSNMGNGDLVWIRMKGIYYLGRISSKSQCRYIGDEDTLNLDVSNQLSNVEWFNIGDESCVPGAISTSFIRGRALQKILKDGVLEYSQLIFNEQVKKDKYCNIRMEDDISTFYSLLSTDDCEDLLCLWLYRKYGYIVIPSTNKKSTELYECVLIDPNTGKHIYPQVKAGEVNINAKEYLELSKLGEVWLFTTKGFVKGVEKSINSIHVANPEDLFAFVGTESAKNVLPQSILKWYEILKKIGFSG